MLIEQQVTQELIVKNPELKQKVSKETPVYTGQAETGDNGHTNHSNTKTTDMARPKKGFCWCFSEMAYQNDPFQSTLRPILAKIAKLFTMATQLQVLQDWFLLWLCLYDLYG